MTCSMAEILHALHATELTHQACSAGDRLLSALQVKRMHGLGRQEPLPVRGATLPTPKAAAANLHGQPHSTTFKHTQDGSQHLLCRLPSSPKTELAPAMQQTSRRSAARFEQRLSRGALLACPASRVDLIPPLLVPQPCAVTAPALTSTLGPKCTMNLPELPVS